MKRYKGDLFWVKLDQASGTTHGESMATVHRAILNDNIFKIDHKNPNGLPDSEIRIRSKDGFKFDGSAKYVDSQNSSALVNLQYYLNGDKAILIGNWVENKIEYLCIAKLNEVESFEN